MENKLEHLDKEFSTNLILLKDYFNKAKKSDAFKDFDAFLDPNQKYIKYIEDKRNKDIAELFDIKNKDIYISLLNDLVNFLENVLIKMKQLIEFFEQAKQRKDINENKMKKSQLKALIKEQVTSILKEDSYKNLLLDKIKNSKLSEDEKKKYLDKCNASDFNSNDIPKIITQIEQEESKKN